MTLLNRPNILSFLKQSYGERQIHVSAVACKTRTGRYKPTIKHNKPLTYEMANPPHFINHRKAWNSWNTSNLKDGNRSSESALEDLFIRRFMIGTWHSLFLSEIIIKRQHNIIRISGIVQRGLHPTKIYFLTGYTEELLSVWLQCPVKMEIVTIDNAKDVIFKYI